MKVLYTFVKGMDPIYIENSEQTQRVLLVFQDNGKTFVYYCDDLNSKVFINEIVSRSLLGFNLNNFKKIEDDDEFNTYVKFISNNYNYSGEHLDHKITDE